MKELMFLNGKLLPIEEAWISASSPGFLLGWGLFETMRSYKNKIVYFDAHLKRILNSSKLIGIKSPYSAERLKKAINETVKINGFKDSYVRLTITKSKIGTDTMVTGKKYTPYPNSKYKLGLRACFSAFRQNNYPENLSLKTTSRLIFELAFKQAKSGGFDEGLILNSSGYICEGTRSNIFIIKGKTLFTPSLSCACLDGITRRAILDLSLKFKVDFKEGLFTIQDLYNADEAFLTNSLMGVMPLAIVEKEKIGSGRRGLLTAFFLEKYNSLLK